MINILFKFNIPSDSFQKQGFGGALPKKSMISRLGQIYHSTINPFQLLSSSHDVARCCEKLSFTFYPYRGLRFKVYLVI